jgi:hypothetical protein
MADETSSTQTLETDTQSASTAIAEKPDFFQRVAKLFDKPKKTGAHCEYCEWTGPAADVLKSPRLNEDGTTYQITTCPRCMRNGGIVIYG